MKLNDAEHSLMENRRPPIIHLTTLVALLLLIASLALASAEDEAKLFKLKCGKCHDPELALKKYRSAEVWQDTIARMKDVHNADISEEEAESLVEFHVKRQQQEASIFEEKCEKCHPGKVFLEKNLSEEQTRAIIQRMQQKSGSTIEDKDIETIIRYHAQSRRAAIMEDLKIYEENTGVQTGSKRQMGLQEGMALFAEKCSECHELKRALTIFKDPEVWDQTIKRMQYYSKGSISDQQAQELVGFHVTEQQREIHAFAETCTQCHDDKRINSRSMTEEQWLATIKRMQKKAPELIPDEKINLLTAYFHRRELTMAKIFSGKCQVCHYGITGQAAFQSSRVQLGGLIVMASEEFGDSFEIKDIESLVSFHLMQQGREMQFYRNNCSTCHPDGPPQKDEKGQLKDSGRSRAEWITYIATLQGQELNKEVQHTINSQIDYHVTRN